MDETRVPTVVVTFARVLAAVLLVVASVAAQAAGLTPVAVILLIVGVVTVAPLALPSLDL